MGPVVSWTEEDEVSWEWESFLSRLAANIGWKAGEGGDGVVSPSARHDLPDPSPESTGRLQEVIVDGRFREGCGDGGSGG